MSFEVGDAATADAVCDSIEDLWSDLTVALDTAGIRDP